MEVTVRKDEDERKLELEKTKTKQVRSYEVSSLRSAGTVLGTIPTDKNKNISPGGASLAGSMPIPAAPRGNARKNARSPLGREYFWRPPMIFP